MFCPMMGDGTPIPKCTTYRKRTGQPKTFGSNLESPAFRHGECQYVNDTRIHVFEISWLTEEQLNKFTSDFKVVANFFVKKRQQQEYVPDDPTEIKHVDEVLKLLSVMTGDCRYEEILKDKCEVRTMCDVAERLESKGRDEGRNEGRRESIVEAIRNMLELGLTKEQILTKYSEEEYAEATKN